MRERGFTLMELLVVLALVAVLAGLVTPIVSSSIQRAKEATLKENLFVLRKAIDDYYADTGAYPPNLDALVEKRYIRKVPADPITERVDSWQVVHEEEGGEEPGIIDVHSGAEETAADGSAYREW
jgi:general secretion pathway protein G